MRKARRLLLAAYYAACALVVAVCLALLALWYLLSPALESQKGQIEEQISRLLVNNPSAVVRIGGISFEAGLPRNYLHLQRLSITDGAGDAELIFVKHAYVELSYRALYDRISGEGGDDAPLRLVVFDPRVSVRREEDGRIFAGGFPLGGGGARAGQIGIPLEFLTVRNGTVAFSDAAGKYPDLLLQGIDLAARLHGGEAAFSLRADGAGFAGAELHAAASLGALLPGAGSSGDFRFELLLPSVDAGGIGMGGDLRILGEGARTGGKVEAGYSASVGAVTLRVGEDTYAAGAGNLSGSLLLLSAPEDGGPLAAHAGAFSLSDVSLDLPGKLMAPTRISALGGQLTLGISDRGWGVAAGEGSASNADATLAFSASASSSGDALRIDVEAQSEGALDATAAPRYLPAAAGEDLAAWLGGAVRAGTIPSFSVSVRGDPARFPHVDGEGGLFRLALEFEGADLDYLAGWPAVAGAAGSLAFEGKEMLLAFGEGSVGEIDVAGSEARIPDLLVFDELLSVSLAGKAPGEALPGALDSLPPLAGRGIAQQLLLGGEAEIAATIEIPLRRAEDVALQGSAALTGGSLALPGAPAVRGAPPQVDEFDARVTFDRDGAAVRGRGSFLGRPAGLSAQVRLDGWEASLEATAAVGEWLADAGAPGIGGALSGEATVTVSGSSGGGLSLYSDLVGVAIGMPAPIGKGADEPAPIRAFFLEDGASADFRDGLLQVRTVDSGPGQVLAGIRRPPPEPEPGFDVVVRGALEGVDVDEWLRAPPGGGDASRPVSAIVEIEDAALLARRHDRLRIELETDQSGQARILLLSEHVDGEITVGPNEAGERVAVANFAKLHAVEEEDEDEEAETPEEDPPPELFPRLPRVVFSAEDLGIGKRRFGKVAMEGYPLDDAWVVERIVTESRGNRITASGETAMAGEPGARLRFDVEVTDIGSFMLDWGAPEGAISEGRATIGGEVRWGSSLLDPSPNTMGGQLSLVAERARFARADSGIFKLFQLLSPDAFLSLGFTETLREGILFERVEGTVAIERGTMRSESIMASSKDLSVELTGTADLADESLDFRARVQPGVAAVNALLGGAALVTAPAAPLAAVVGWVAGKIFEEPLNAIKQPFSEIGAYEYTITGTWDDPVYEEGGG